MRLHLDTHAMILQINSAIYLSDGDERIYIVDCAEWRVFWALLAPFQHRLYPPVRTSPPKGLGARLRPAVARYWTVDPEDCEVPPRCVWGDARILFIDPSTLSDDFSYTQAAQMWAYLDDSQAFDLKPIRSF